MILNDCYFDLLRIFLNNVLINMKKRSEFIYVLCKLSPANKS